MAQTIFGADFAVSALNRAFFNASPGNAVFNSQKGTAGNTAESQYAFATQMASQFTSLTDDQLSTLVLTNMGVLPSTAPEDVGLQTALASYFGQVGKGNRGIVVLQLSSILASLETTTGDLAVYNDSAKAWNKEVLASFNYSSNVANTSPFQGDFPAGNPSDGQTFTLTTGQDVFNGTDGNDLVRGVAGTPIGGQDQTTLNSSDILKGGAGADSLILLLNGNYGGGATVRDFETLQLGTNTIQAGGVNFDYNVNQGAYEISGTNTVVFDQITTGEVLNVNNITPTGADGKAPTLEWANEAGSRAGTVSANYRQATTAGTADNQNVTLKNVNGMAAVGDAILNLGGGMESVTITSTGAVANNTLNYSANVDPTGSNGGAADIVSAGSLGKVILKGDVAIGKTGGVIAATNPALQGLTDRTAGSDFGPSPWGTPTDSNLLSVGSRVTEVDASEMTGAANVRFVAKTNGTGTNVTFKGGKGSDYAEFELGNVTATGGEGDDTFAFINAGANATFGEGDKIDGGAGADTMQLGLNGNGTYNVSETELRNKTSIETLDLRGNVNNLTLSSDFVAASDTAGTVTVRTDKIVQTSATDSANAVGNTNNASENVAVSTIDLTKLSSSQGVNFLGGSGSDRIILNDAAFNVQQMLDGGTPSVDTMVGAGRYDTITVTTSGGNVVIDAADLSNVKNFEGLVLTKNSAAATYNITLTRTFLNANTQAADNANTSIVDTNFQIGTSNAANNSALAAGDTVTIDVRDLLNAGDNGRAAGFTVRTFDITALENAGVNVVFVGNTGNLTAAQARAAGVLVTKGFDANFGHVVVGSAANPSMAPAVMPIVFTGNSGNTTSGFEIQGNRIASAADDTIDVQGRVLAAGAVINGSGGTDTLTATNGADLSAAAITSVENLSFAGKVTLTQAQNNAFTTINGTSAADTLAMNANGAVTTHASVETYDFTAGLTTGTVVGTSTGAGGQTFIVAGNFSIADTLTGGAGTADVMRTDYSAAVTDINNVSGIETIVLTETASAYTWAPAAGSAFVNDTTKVTFDATAMTAVVNLDLTAVDNRGVTVNLNKANAAADVITVDTTVANIVNAHSVSGLGAGDTIAAAGGGGGTVYTVDLATFNVASFAGDVNAALAAKAGYAAAANDLILVRVGGLETNVYAVQDITGNGVNGTDAVVHLVGTHSVIIDGSVIV